jgi:hypothetical protein
MSLAVYEAMTGIAVDPGWSRGESVRQESVAVDPPAGPGLAENAQALVEEVEAAKLPLAETSWLQKPPENRQNVVPNPRSAAPASPPNPATRESTKPVPPPYPAVQEPVYREKPVYWDEW